MHWFIGLLYFLLWHPMGETVLFIFLGLYLWWAHQRGKVHGRAFLEIVGFIAATIAGLWVPSILLFLVALGYVILRIRRATRERDTGTAAGDITAA